MAEWVRPQVTYLMKVVMIQWSEISEITSREAGLITK